MKLVYPAIFYSCEEKTGYTVVVPDLPGCVSEGDNLADAILMGTDAAAGWVLGELEDGNSVPSPSDPATLKPTDDGIVNLLVLDMDSYAEKYGDKAIRKNITIPAYMNTFMQNHGLSLSKVVQDAIGAQMQSLD